MLSPHRRLTRLPPTPPSPAIDPAVSAALADGVGVMPEPGGAGDQRLGRALKRLIDLGGALAGLLLLGTLLAPLTLAVVLAIRADGGPVVFRHRRIGRGGRPFHCLKLRTMALDADQALARALASDPLAAAEWQQAVKLRRDPRITPIGQLLRRTSLDELPQLINVLVGDMSLVGPRPIVAAEVPRYGADLGYYLQVQPGITGLWQVSGRNAIDYPTRVSLDVCYVRHWSLRQDLWILLRTVPAVVSGRGAC